MTEFSFESDLLFWSLYFPGRANVLTSESLEAWVQIWPVVSNKQQCLSRSQTILWVSTSSYPTHNSTPVTQLETAAGQKSQIWEERTAKYSQYLTIRKRKLIAGVQKQSQETIWDSHRLWEANQRVLEFFREIWIFFFFYCTVYLHLQISAHLGGPLSEAKFVEA